MRIFITGATGFLGKHILDICIRKKFQILALTRKKNIFKNSKNVRWICADLSDVKFITKEINSFRPDTVIHLAWENIPDFSAEICLKNHYNSVNLLDNIIKSNHLKKIICPGSCREYSDRTGSCKETDIIQPTSFFTRAKISLHEYLKQKSLKNKIDYYWFRIFFLYGPGQRGGSIIPSIVNSFKNNTTPIIFNPFNKNDFIFVRDAAQMMLQPLLSKIRPGIYNIGTGKATSVIKVCSIIEKIFFNTNKFTKSLYGKKNANQQVSYFADTDKMIKNLKITNLTKIETGINDYIKNSS